jgi:hypothetical protein
VKNIPKFKKSRRESTWQRKHSLRKPIRSQSLKSENIVDVQNAGDHEHTIVNLDSVGSASGNWHCKVRFLVLLKQAGKLKLIISFGEINNVND